METSAGPDPAEDLSVLPAAAAAAAAAAPSTYRADGRYALPIRWRLSVHRRSFDFMTEEFSRIVTDWAADIAALKVVLLAGKTHNDEYASNKGACDMVSVCTPADADGLGPPMPFCGRNTIALEDWLRSLRPDALPELAATAAEEGCIDAVMGSSHHNAPQWFIRCAVENPDTAVTVILLRSTPEVRFEDIVYPPCSYQFTEHAADLHAAVRFIANHCSPDDGKMTVTEEGDSPVIVTIPHRYSCDYSALDGFSSLPLFLEGRERSATVTVTLTRTV